LNKKTVIAAAIAATLSACTQPQPPVSHIDRVQAGDNSLTCPQIRDQIADMNKLLGISNTAQGAENSNLSTTGGVTATTGIGSSLANIPLVGGVVGVVGGQMQNQQTSQAMQAQQDADDAKARKENLVALGNGKGCFNTAKAK
jgi:hypothetical protein